MSTTVESVDALHDAPAAAHRYLSGSGLPLRAAGPFNHPTELMPGPSGDLYVTDGYRNSRVHRFTKDGELVQSWGQPGKSAPGEFHLPHSMVTSPDGTARICSFRSLE